MNWSGSSAPGRDSQRAHRRRAGVVRGDRDFHASAEAAQQLGEVRRAEMQVEVGDREPLRVEGHVQPSRGLRGGAGHELGESACAGRRDRASRSNVLSCRTIAANSNGSIAELARFGLDRRASGAKGRSARNTRRIVPGARSPPPNRAAHRPSPTRAPTARRSRPADPRAAVAVVPAARALPAGLRYRARRASAYRAGRGPTPPPAWARALSRARRSGLRPATCRACRP